MIKLRMKIITQHNRTFTSDPTEMDDNVYRDVCRYLSEGTIGNLDFPIGGVNHYFQAGLVADSVVSMEVLDNDV